MLSVTVALALQRNYSPVRRRSTSKNSKTCTCIDPAKARALVREAGYPEGVDVTWLLLNTTEYKQIGEAVQSMLGDVGIRITFDVVDVSQYYTFRRPPRRGDILMVRWVAGPIRCKPFRKVPAVTHSRGAR